MTDTMFILSESIDEGITRMWHFQVTDKYEMAQFIIAHIGRYDSMGMFNGISWQSGLARWRKSGQLTPETLLKAIGNSSIDGDSESRFEIRTIDLSHNGGEGADVTYTKETEFAEFAQQSVISA
jgi:hypothetical protein